MTKIRLAMLALVLAVACTSPSAQTTQDRKVSGFSAIDVSEGITVILTIGDKESVEVTAPEDYIDKVITEVSGDELDIYIKGNNTGNKGRNIEVRVVAKKITRIESSSGSSVKTTNTIAADDLKVDVSSGAHVYVSCEAEKVAVSTSSGSGANLKGNATYLKADASSGSHIKAHELKAKKVSADVSSGASIRVYAEEQLNADASSGGSISYLGSPEMVDVDKSSGGSVNKK